MNMEATERTQFLDHYRTIRHAEGRGSEDPAYYLALPYKDLSGNNSEQWRIRGKSFRYFERVKRRIDPRVRPPGPTCSDGSGPQAGYLSRIT